MDLRELDPNPSRLDEPWWWRTSSYSGSTGGDCVEVDRGWAVGRGSAARAGPAFAARIRAVAAISAAATALRAVVFP
ncbi:DUF397 domain-containing protein [Streptomyces sp. NPDC059680]|uniref:DUF397 domain-containing protein n=1 Tax=Streptomyces sp. NPDC059680 TaxID=3346904 RepID=UPI0036A807ED